MYKVDELRLQVYKDLNLADLLKMSGVRDVIHVITVYKVQLITATSVQGSESG